MNVTNKIKYNKIIAALLLLYSLAPLLNERINSVFLFGLMPILFLLSIFQYPNFIRDNKVFRYYLLYFVFSVLTILWADDRQLSMTHIRAYLGGFIIIYVFSSLSTNEKYMKLFRVFYFLYLGACLMLGFREFGFGVSDIGSERVGSTELNSNRFGYFVFIITFYLYYWGEINPKKKIWKYLFFITIPFTFYISLITASRQILIIQVPFIAFLLFRRYSRNFGLGTVALIFVLMILTAVLSDRLVTIYETSLLAERMSIDVNDDERTALIRLGFNIGNNHFFTGVGFSNFRLYSGGYISHCTYAEAYAEGGIIQLVLFLMVLISFEINQMKRYRLTKNNSFIIIFVTGLFYAVFNLFYVFPSFALVMAFIFIIESESKHRFSEITASINNKPIII